MDPSKSVKYFDSALCITAYWRTEPWCTSLVISPEELSFLYAMKRGGPKQGMEGGYDWSALASFMGQIDRAAVTMMNLINLWGAMSSLLGQSQYILNILEWNNFEIFLDKGMIL